MRGTGLFILLVGLALVAASLGNYVGWRHRIRAQLSRLPIHHQVMLHRIMK